MGQFLPLLFGIGGLASAFGGIASSNEARRRTERAFAPGGSMGPIPNAGAFNLGPDEGFGGPNADILAGILRDRGSAPAYFTAEQNRLNQEALRQQRGLAEESRNQVRTGALSKAEHKVGELLDINAEAIPQATFDKLVAQFLEQSNAQFASNAESISGDAARHGLSPDAEAAIRARSRTDNAIANRAGERDLAVQRELANRDYTTQLLGLAGQIGSTFNQQVGAANADVAATYQPPDIAAIGDILQQNALAELGGLNEQDQALANVLMSLSGGLLDYSSALTQARAMRSASSQRPSALGPVLGFAGQLGGGFLGNSGLFGG